VEPIVPSVDLVQQQASVLQDHAADYYKIQMMVLLNNMLFYRTEIIM
jgi:hypothetical protein